MCLPRQVRLLKIARDAVLTTGEPINDDIDNSEDASGVATARVAQLMAACATFAHQPG